MKFTLFVLIIGFSCLLAASLKDDSSTASLSTELGYEGVANNVIGNDDMKRFINPWSAAKKFACTIKPIVKINGSTLKFVIKIRGCGDDAAVDNVNVVTAAASDLVSNINGILNLNKKLYHNSTYMDSETPPEFSPELYNRSIDLTNQVSDTINSIGTVVGAGICATKTLADFQTALTKFSVAMGKCLTN